MKLRFLVPILVTVCLSASTSVATAASNESRSHAIPPHGIYTCAWISQHRAAAMIAHVTCDRAVFLAALNSPGSLVETAPPQSIAVMCPAGPFYVPNGARVGQGVFAWSDFYTNADWQWRGIWAPASYTWYLKRSDGLTDHNDVSDTDWYQQLAYGSYQWGAQNHSTTAQEWEICFG